MYGWGKLFLPVFAGLASTLVTALARVPVSVQDCTALATGTNSQPGEVMIRSGDGSHICTKLGLLGLLGVRNIHISRDNLDF